MTHCTRSTIAGLFLVALVSGCATNIPKEISEPPPNNTSLSDVRKNIAPFLGTRVRWGGTIALVENHATETWIEVVARDLTHTGSPTESDMSPGRFIAIVNGFLDPVIYGVGRNITVAGTVEKEIKRKISEYEYTFPVLHVDHYLLWEKYDPTPPYWYFEYWYPYPYPPHRPRR